MRKSFWYILFLLSALSCLDQPDCVHTNNDQVGILFRTMFDGRPDTVVIRRIRLGGTSFVITDSLKRVNFTSVPLNYLTDTTTFLIETLNRSYLMNVGFKVKPQFVQVSCPERFIFSDLTIREQVGADSIRLNSSALSNPAQGNIYVYRCPSNTLLKMSFRQWGMDTTRGKLDTRTILKITDDFTGFVYPKISTHTVYLPINVASTKTSYTFLLDDSTTHKLDVTYGVPVKTLFSQCPNQIFPNKIKVPLHDFGILHITKDSIYDPPKTNLEVYRCPITNQINAIFKNALGGSAKDTLKSITADHLGTDTLYRNVITTSVLLPVDPNADNTTYHFQFKNKTSVVTIGYLRTAMIYHSDCGTQQKFTSLAVTQFSNLSAAPKITKPDIVFPTQTTLEIVQ